MYVGYTPGYLGTVVEPDGVVVYGTGYDYDPWVGNVWYAPPETYGIAAQPIYSPAVGYSYGYGLGLMTPVVVGAWGSPYYYGSAYHGYPVLRLRQRERVRPLRRNELGWNEDRVHEPTRAWA